MIPDIVLVVCPFCSLVYAAPCSKCPGCKKEMQKYPGPHSGLAILHDGKILVKSL